LQRAKASSMSGRGLHWITEPHEERPIRWKEGEAGIANTKPITVMEVFKATTDKFGTKTALGVKRDGEWKTWTFQQYYDQTKIAAKALIKIGVARFDGICILGFNSPEWFIADLGAIYAGGIVAGIYTTNGPEACQYIAEHAKASVIFVENESQLKKILQIRKNLPNLKKIVQWGGKVDEQEGVLSWEAFMASGKDVADSELNDRIQAQKPESCCTLIYTSGTTGPPKAVMISHDNVTWTANAVCTVLEITESDSIISYLPLSHICSNARYPRSISQRSIRMVRTTRCTQRIIGQYTQRDQTNWFLGSTQSMGKDSRKNARSWKSKWRHR